MGEWPKRPLRPSGYFHAPIKARTNPHPASIMIQKILISLVVVLVGIVAAALLAWAEFGTRRRAERNAPTVDGLAQTGDR